MSWPRVSGGSLRRTASCSGPCHRAPPKRQTRSSVRMNADWRPPLMPTPMERGRLGQVERDALGVVVELGRPAAAAAPRWTGRGSTARTARRRPIGDRGRAGRSRDRATARWPGGRPARPTVPGPGRPRWGWSGRSRWSGRYVGQVGHGGLLGFRRDKRSDFNAFPAHSPWQPPGSCQRPVSGAGGSGGRRSRPTGRNSTTGWTPVRGLLGRATPNAAEAQGMGAGRR